MSKIQLCLKRKPYCFEKCALLCSMLSKRKIITALFAEKLNTEVKIRKPWCGYWSSP